MDDRLRLRRFTLVSIALIVVLVVGTIGFHWIAGENFLWPSTALSSRVSLTGLDTKPVGHPCGPVGRTIRDLRVRAQTRTLIVGLRHATASTTRRPRRTRGSRTATS